jgi:hypothetical protein
VVTQLRAKQTSAEVTAAAEHKATLQCLANDLECQRIEMLAEMELEEELLEEQEQCTVVRKLGDSSGLDNVEDVAMQSEDGVGGDPTFVEGKIEVESEANSEDNKAIAGKKAVPKGKQGVCWILQILQQQQLITHRGKRSWRKGRHEQPSTVSKSA